MYKLDTQAARDADQFGNYLNESGKYIGKFTRAEKLVSQGKGTHGIGFTFEDQSKRTTRFDLWTVKANGEHIQGYKYLNAIMTVLKLRELSERPATVDRYDYEAKQMTKVQADVFPDLMDKPIGIILRNTEYAKVRDGRETGETGWRLELVAPFDANTEFTAGEILDKKTKPEKLTAILAMLQDRPMKARPLATAPSPSTPSGGGGFNDMDDDIPFGPMAVGRGFLAM